MSKISQCIDEFEAAKLNTAQMFFFLLSYIPTLILLPFWVVAKFIYGPYMEKLDKRMEIPPIPFGKRWPIDEATDDGDKIVNEKSVVYENTPKGSVILKYNYEDEIFEYWSDSKTLTYKELEVVSRKYVTVFCCKNIYIDRLALQQENVDKAREKYLNEKEGIEAESSSDDEESSLFVKTTMEKAKETNKEYMRGDMVDINKLLTVENANKYKRLGTFNECEIWNNNKTQIKQPVSNLSFAAFKNKIWSDKVD